MTKILFLCIVALLNLAVGYAAAVQLRRGIFPWGLALSRMGGPWFAGRGSGKLQEPPQSESDAPPAESSSG